MKDFEKKISPLIASQFPSFYQEEGQNFIAFVKAYYEWLEQEDNTLYHSRRLLNYRDIDETVDDFIVHFKDKYLSNIQFTTATNKKLLVKKVQDLYRSKGTPRAIDLFFKLVYGIETRVYIPGQDVFKASDGKYVKPIYLEVTRQARNIDYIGKQVTGASSGATAFVEKLVRRRIKGQYIDIFYISAVNGTFVTNEVILINEIFDDAPIMIGSMTGLQVIDKATGYKIGDIVDVISTINGGYGKARVISISDASGVVEFELIEGGFGYTSAANVIVSEKVLTLANVITSNATLSTPFKLFETLVQPIANVTYQPVLEIPLVSNTGAFTNGEVVYQETSGINTAFATVITSNSSALLLKYPNTGFITSSLTIKGVTSGANAVIGNFTNPTDLISAGEIYTNYYTNNAIAGQGIVVQNFTNSTPYIGVLKVAISNGNIYNSANANYSESIYLGNTTAPNTLRFTLRSYANVYATANVMGIPDNITLYLSDYISTISIGETISQGTANAIVSRIEPDGSNVYVYVTDTKGVFQLGQAANTANGSGNISSYSMTLGVYDINNTFTNTAHHYVFGSTSNTYANVLTVSAGDGAGFSITGYDNEEQVVIGTDRISGLNNSGIAYNTLSINTLYYGFPKFPSGNLTNGTLLQQLSYFSGNVGTISSIGNINPGSNYNVDPFVLVYDPYIAPFNRKDLLITYDQDTLTDFIEQEIITQSVNIPGTFVVGLTGVNGTFVVNEKVTQANSSSPVANGYVSSINIVGGQGTITVRNIQGTFVNTGFNTANSLIGYTSSANASIANVSAVAVTSVAKGIIKEVSNTTLVVKPITFNTQFVPGPSRILGTSSGANGTVLAISEIADSLPSGINADVQADVITANGVVNALQRIDSGFGYIKDQIVQYQKPGGLVGSARVSLGEQGVGEGYYTSSDGFLSFDKKLFDGDYYQEYSYEIISKLPFEKYADIFKQVLHTAGTRVFGSVELYSLDNSDALPVHNGNKILKIQVNGISNTENFVNNEIVYQSNGSANVATGKYYGGKETEIVLSTSANTRYQLDTIFYQPNSSVNAASGVIKGKIANTVANTLTLYLGDVKGSFVSTSNVQGTTNTVLTVSYYFEADLINVTNPAAETGSFIFGETVTTDSGFIGTIRYANVFEAEIVPITGIISVGDTVVGSTSLCSADVNETTGTIAQTGEYVYHPHTTLFIENIQNGPFLEGEEVYTQEQTVAAGQVFQKRGIGMVFTANSIALTLEDSFAGFNRGLTLFGNTSGASARISRLEYANDTIGYVIAANTSTITLVDTDGLFKVGAHIYGANAAAVVDSITYNSRTTPTSNISSVINTILVANATGQFTTNYQLVAANSGTTANVLYVDRYND